MSGKMRLKGVRVNKLDGRMRCVLTSLAGRCGV